jgi:hypothetical protein
LNLWEKNRLFESSTFGKLALKSNRAKLYWDIITLTKNQIELGIEKFDYLLNLTFLEVYSCIGSVTKLDFICF